MTIIDNSNRHPHHPEGFCTVATCDYSKALLRQMRGEDVPVCPRCHGFIPNNEHPDAYPGALSRKDNETYICSHCGTLEAIFNFAHPGEPLPPVDREVLV